MLSAAEARWSLLSSIADGRAVTFIKFGDGEFLAMHGHSGQTINGDTYGIVVKQALLSALHYLAPRVMVAKWPDHAPHADLRRIYADKHSPAYADYTTLLLQEDNVSDMLDFWKEVMRTGRPLTYVAPARMAAVASWLGAKHIVINDANAYPIDPQGIAPAGTCIIGAGFAAKPLIHHLHQALPDLSLLDVGSGLDVLAGTITRVDQPDPAATIRTFGL